MMKTAPKMYGTVNSSLMPRHQGDHQKVGVKPPVLAVQTEYRTEDTKLGIGYVIEGCALLVVVEK